MTQVRYFFITYEEAEKLKPVFRDLRKMAPSQDMRESASRIYQELSYVRKQDYSPFPGKQLGLNEKDKWLFDEVIKTANL